MENQGEQGQTLQKLAATEYLKLTEVGHELGEWVPDGELQLRNDCKRCQGYVTVSVGDVNAIAYVPLMNPDLCLADNPEQMAATNEEWGSRLGKAYDLILRAYWSGKVMKNK